MKYEGSTYWDQDEDVKLRVVTGQEKYRVVDLTTGGEQFFDEKLDAYKHAAILVRLGRNYRLEVRS